MRSVLNIYDTRSFLEYLRSDHELAHEHPIPLEVIPSVLSDTSNVSSYIPPYNRLFAHMSPLRDDLCTIWTVTEDGSPWRTLVHRYHFLLHPSCQLVPSISRHFKDKDDDYTALFALHISYSGYVALAKHKIISLENSGSDPNRARVIHHFPLNRAKDLRVSTYSGALTYTARHQVFVDYYL
jgi:hypothetical protein